MEYHFAPGLILIKRGLFGYMILISFYIPVICKHGTTAPSLLIPRMSFDQLRIRSQ
jgi:hypothetical protein